jgi:hypothetical protein
VDEHIASLLASSFFRMTAAQLLLIDLRTTFIRTEAVITIFKTCPLLKELDVGECKKLSVLELARSLEEVPRERLVVEHLQKMEICGSGSGNCWIGYRQKLCFDGYDMCFPSERGYLSVTHGGGKAQKVGLPARELPRLERFQQLGSSNVLPAVRAIEAIIHSIQQTASPFCMHVNGCEECLHFAQYVDHDGKGDHEHYDGKTYGQHACMVCGDARFLCLDCVGYSYHYCAEEHCNACVCVKCDGGRSVTALLRSGREDLLGEGTTHFKIVECCWEHTGQCQFPIKNMILCKDKKVCNKDPRDPDWAYGPDLCPTCGKWQCGWCPNGRSFQTCEGCDIRPCAMDSSIIVNSCDSCDCDLCNTCGPVRDCEDGCERVQGVNGTMRAVSHCTECYLERHPPVEVGLPVMVAATAQAEGEEGDLRQEENAA